MITVRLLAISRCAEFWTLAGLALVLPLFEAPKTIFWACYLLLWVANRAFARDFGGRWDMWDTLIAAWIGSGILVGVFAGVDHKQWQGSSDLLRYGSLLWCMKRSRYDDRQLKILFSALVLGTCAALAQGYWRAYVTHTRGTLELNSVGHVNHSAIFLDIATGLAASALFAYWAKLAAAWRAVLLAVSLAFLMSQFVMESRVAVAGGLTLLAVLGLVWTRRAVRLGVATLIAIISIATAAVAFKADVVLKQQQRVQEGNVASYRLQIWNTALLAWREFPVWGLGMSNYSAVSPELVSAWLAKRGEPTNSDEYFHSSGHAHSIYVNTLAERGLAGTLPLMAVLLAWLYTLIRSLPQAGDEDRTWALWGGALSAWFITVTIGIVNTTLHHEHALLAMMLLGGWLAERKRLAEPRGVLEFRPA